MDLSCYPHINAAFQRSSEIKDRIEHALANRLCCQSGLCLAVFGSLARGEFGPGSDLDWTIISRPESLHLADEFQRYIENLIRDLGINQPKAGGAFATVTVDVDIWRDIGKKTDGRAPLSKRMLLLSEGLALGDKSVYDEMIKSILQIYHGNESLVSGLKYILPRFLINDIMLFWRMMSTDFAAISRGPGWGLRALKMAMSRKTLFVSCLLWATESRAMGREANDPDVELREFYEKLQSSLGKTPIERLSDYLMSYSPDDCKEAIACYDRFLAVIHDKQCRLELESRTYLEIRNDPKFLNAWRNAGQFHRFLIGTFFGRDVWMKDFVEWACFI